MVFRIQFGTLIAPPAVVNFGAMFLDSQVGAWLLAPQVFDTLNYPNQPQFIDITCQRPGVLAFNKAQFVVPSNVRQDGLPWVLNLYCDWRVATLVEWSIVDWVGDSQDWADEATIDIDVPSGAAWACTPLISSTLGPVHPDTTTIVFTPTHTEPGSTGSWVFSTASASNDSDTAPTVYNYPFRVFAPFLADNVIPQTADLTITIRKNDCTTETRTVHLRFFDTGTPPDAPVIVSRSMLGIGSSGDVESASALGAGPTPLMASAESPGGIAPGCLYTNSLGETATTSLSVTLIVSGTAPITYQWEYTLNGVTWVTLVDGPFYEGTITGTTTATLYIGAVIPGLNRTSAGLYRCTVTNPAGSTVCQPLPYIDPCDG